jgi:hypothetical protein
MSAVFWISTLGAAAFVIAVAWFLVIRAVRTVRSLRALADAISDEV